MTEKKESLIAQTIDRKYELALNKLGGRLKLCAIIIKRFRDLRQLGLVQKGSFSGILEPVLDEIIEEKLVWDEPEKRKK